MVKQNEKHPNAAAPPLGKLVLFRTQDLVEEFEAFPSWDPKKPGGTNKGTVLRPDKMEFAGWAESPRMIIRLMGYNYEVAIGETSNGFLTSKIYGHNESNKPFTNSLVGIEEGKIGFDVQLSKLSSRIIGTLPLTKARILMSLNQMIQIPRACSTHWWHSTIIIYRFRVPWRHR